MNKIKLETIKINDTNYLFDLNYLLTLEEIQKWFDYTTEFSNNLIYLKTNSDLEEYNNTYKDIKSYTNDWISTLEDAMNSDENIDFSDWLKVLENPNSYTFTK